MAASSASAASTASTGPSAPVVVIAVDQSKLATEAVDYYFDHIWQKTHKLILLHVIELPDMSHARQAHLTPSALYEMWMEENTKSKDLEIRYAEILNQRGVGIKDAVFRTTNGLKPGEVIVDVATEEKATMIVMGTRGMGLIRRTVLGSASDYVVHHAPCAVVVCRRREEHQKIAQGETTSPSNDIDLTKFSTTPC